MESGAGGALKDAATGDGVSLPPGTYAPIAIDAGLRGQLVALIDKLAPALRLLVLVGCPFHAPAAT